VQRQLSRATGTKASELAQKLQGLYDDDAAALSQIQSINEASARDARERGERLKASAEKRRTALLDALKAGLARGTAAEKAFERERRNLIRDAVRGGTGGRRLGRTGRLTLGDVNARLSAREQAAQFQALGLSATGEERVPFAATLRRQATQIRQAIKGTPLDTNKNRNLLRQISDVLSGENKRLGRVTEETRRTIKGMLDAIRDPLKDADDPSKGFKHLRPQELARRLGLDVSGLSTVQRRQLFSNLATLGPNGTVPGRSAAFSRAGAVHYHGDIHVHGVDDLGKFEAAMARRERGRPQRRRGAG